MGRKHKHEEHVNLERWVISYADMITLLFALFVVLYALGIDKMKNEVAQSIAFALHIQGEGRTQEEGPYDRGKDGAGAIPDAAPLLNSQKGAMREYLEEKLPREFKEETGASLEIIATEDTIAFKGPLSGFFQRGRKDMLPKVQPWLADLVRNAHTMSSRVRIQIEAPEHVLGRGVNGVVRKSGDLCLERLQWIHLLVLTNVESLQKEQVQVEFRYRDFGIAGDWEDVGRITFAFTNQALDPWQK